MRNHRVILSFLTAVMLIETTFICGLSRVIPLKSSANFREIGEEYINQPEYFYNPEKQKNGPVLIALIGTDEMSDERSRSDVIMVIKYYPDTKKVLLVSVPRDSRVEIPGRGIDKINAAHAYGGPELLRQTLEELFHTSIPYYIHINFEGFISIVDAVGGIRVDAKKDFYDYWRGSDVYIKKGENILDGEHLLKYVRFRHDEEGDFGRIKRQQEVVLSAARQLITPENIFALPRILGIVKKNVESNIDWIMAWEFARSMKDINDANIETHTLQTRSKIINGIWYEIVDREDLQFWIEELDFEQYAAL